MSSILMPDMQTTYQDHFEFYSPTTTLLVNDIFSADTYYDYENMNIFGDALSFVANSSLTPKAFSVESEGSVRADRPAFLTELDEISSADSINAMNQSHQEWMKTHSATATLMDHYILSAESFEDLEFENSSSLRIEDHSNLQIAPNANAISTEIVAEATISRTQKTSSIRHKSPKPSTWEASSEDDHVSKRPRGRPRLDCQFHSAADVSLEILSSIRST